MEQQRTRNSGFASMDRSKQKEIARKGGMAAHRKGTAHEFTTDEARAAGRKGGESVSANKTHMAMIGRLGGKRSAERRRLNAAAGNDNAATAASSSSELNENQTVDTTATMGESPMAATSHHSQFGGMPGGESHDRHRNPEDQSESREPGQ